MSQVYTGAFTIIVPVISGTVTDTNGQPLANVLLQQDGGPSSSLTDSNGVYVLGVDPGWTGNVIPYFGDLFFVPGLRFYNNVVASRSNQNYLAVDSLAVTLSTSRQGSNLSLNWFGINGVNYEPQYSTNLVDWLPYAGPLTGTNGPAGLLVPMDADPQKFFRIKASN